MSCVSLVPHCTPAHRDRFHFVPAALRVKLPTNVALISNHGSAMIQPAIHGLGRQREVTNWSTRSEVGMGICSDRTNIGNARRYGQRGFVMEHQPHVIPIRIPTSHLGSARFPVLRCAVVTARCSYVASLTPGIHALRDRRNPAAGPVIAATSMHAAGCAVRSSIL